MYVFLGKYNHLGLNNAGENVTATAVEIKHFVLDKLQSEKRWLH